VKYDEERRYSNEAPHRILEALVDIETEPGGRPVVVRANDEAARGVHPAPSARSASRAGGDTVIKARYLVIGKSNAVRMQMILGQCRKQSAELERDGMPRMDAVKLVARRGGSLSGMCTRSRCRAEQEVKSDRLEES